MWIDLVMCPTRPFLCQSIALNVPGKRNIRKRESVTDVCDGRSDVAARMLPAQGVAPARCDRLHTCCHLWEGQYTRRLLTGRKHWHILSCQTMLNMNKVLERLAIQQRVRPHSSVCVSVLFYHLFLMTNPVGKSLSTLLDSQGSSC